MSEEIQIEEEHTVMDYSESHYSALAVITVDGKEYSVPFKFVTYFMEEADPPGVTKFEKIEDDEIEDDKEVPVTVSPELLEEFKELIKGEIE